MAERTTRTRTRDHTGRSGGSGTKNRSETKNGSAGEGGLASPVGEEMQRLVSALAGRALSGVGDRVGGLTDKLTDRLDNPGGKALADMAGQKAQGGSTLRAGLSAGMHSMTDKLGTVLGRGGSGGSGGEGKKLKVTNIVEEIDIGAPVRVVYDQWTKFEQFSQFMKKVEHVDAEDSEGEDKQELTFKAQVLWSHRTWRATITEQVPDKRIVWTSTGEKGSVDGAVTFHELAPELTRVLVVLEYRPQGLFERTGNIWRAQGRRVRLELKHFRRHVMTESMLHPEEIEGWRGEIHDGEITTTHEDAVADEQPAGDDQEEDAEDLADEDEDFDDEDEEDYDEDDEEDDEENQ